MQSSKNSKEREENFLKLTVQSNRGKQQNGKDQRCLQENQRYQGTFHAKMGTIKNRNIMDLTEAVDINNK